jgi:hypothetical protein
VAERGAREQRQRAAFAGSPPWSVGSSSLRQCVALEVSGTARPDRWTSTVNIERIVHLGRELDDRATPHLRSRVSPAP